MASGAGNYQTRSSFREVALSSSLNNEQKSTRKGFHPIDRIRRTGLHSMDDIRRMVALLRDIIQWHAVEIRLRVVQDLRL